MSLLADAGAAAGLAAAAAGTTAGSWKNRLRDAALVSPKGTRIKFKYLDVSREIPLRGTVFEFPNVDGGYVQRSGFGPRQYPLQVYFDGPQHDLVATAFEAALLEPGIFKLEHPLYGSIPKVVPFGTITRRDDLASRANLSVIEVTFWSTTGAAYPSVQGDAQSEILASLGSFNVMAAQQFNARMNLRGALNKATAKATLQSYLRKVSAALTKASQAVSKVRRQFAEGQAQINGAIDILIGQPLLLAQQVSNLIQAPARALSGVTARLAGYQTLARDIMASAQAAPELTLQNGMALNQRTQRITNDLHFSDLFVLNSVAGAAVSITAQPITDDESVAVSSQGLAGTGSVSQEPQFLTKPDALTAASALMLQFDEAVEWRDSAFEAVQDLEGGGAAVIDTGEAYQALQEAVALTAGYLIQVSFTLAAERRVVLDRDRTIIDLTAELYGEVDGKLDFLINTNNLSGSEILELPMGKTIRYYNG